MNISGINSTGMQPNAAAMGAGEQTDPVSKDLQNQIEKLRNDLKEISADQNMPTEAKMKKRQEIQKQISELEIQLRQHQMEVKREKRQKKKEESSFDELAGTKPQEKQQNGKQNTGMSTGSMEAMISADMSVKQANVNGSTARKMEGKANVLEAEIKLDGGRGGSSNVNLKEAELSKVKEAAQKATASQMDSLAQASETLQESSKTEASDNRKNDEKNADSSDKEDQENKDINASNSKTDDEDGFLYHPVDVRL